MAAVDAVSAGAFMAVQRTIRRQIDSGEALTRPAAFGKSKCLLERQIWRAFLPFICRPALLPPALKIFRRWNRKNRPALTFSNRSGDPNMAWAIALCYSENKAVRAVPGCGNLNPAVGACRQGTTIL